MVSDSPLRQAAAVWTNLKLLWPFASKCHGHKFFAACMATTSNSAAAVVSTTNANHISRNYAMQTARAKITETHFGWKYVWWGLFFHSDGHRTIFIWSQIRRVRSTLLRYLQVLADQNDVASFRSAHQRNITFWPLQCVSDSRQIPFNGGVVPDLHTCMVKINWLSGNCTNKLKHLVIVETKAQLDSLQSNEHRDHLIKK